MLKNRRSIRLREYDYSRAGVYFITVCAQDRECLFGEIADGRMVLNDAGRIVADEWGRIAGIRTEIEWDQWIVMPNHFHGILTIPDSVRAIHESPRQMTAPQCRKLTIPDFVRAIHESPRQMTVTERRNMTLPKLIGRFKMLSSKRINEMRNTPGVELWQRNYYEHIIRNDDELNRIREYIVENPAKWAMDRENPWVGDG